MNERPFSKPIEPIVTSSFETVNFPCDNEKTSNGIASIGWRGPHINNVEELISLDLIFSYLTDSSVSTLQSHFIHKNSLCNRVKY
jgi:Zn-dependent M16 (insulinase) family peptidase